MAAPGYRRIVATALWVLLLALLPWWLGLPLLLSVVAVQLLDLERLQPHAATFRSALRWGLPGALLALLRWLGNDALAWAITAVATLVGFTLLAGLEAWLGRSAGAASVAPEAGAHPEGEWPELAMAPLARTGTGIVELVPAQWQAVTAPLSDPRGGSVSHVTGQEGIAGFVFADGGRIEAAASRCCLSPGGRWLALEMDAGLLLFDRDRRARHRLRRWRLCGWHHEQPWLQRSEGEMPLPLESVQENESGD